MNSGNESSNNEIFEHTILESTQYNSETELDEIANANANDFENYQFDNLFRITTASLVIVMACLGAISLLQLIH